MPCSHLPPADPPDPLRVEDPWLTEMVLALARGIAADLGFDRLPILADALEDAGCDNLALLNHLRSADPHRVECWALRRLLRTTLMLPGGVPMVFAYCPPGTFLMGSDSKDANDCERPVHRVTLTKGFFAGIYPVTQEQWRAVMGTDPSRCKGDDRPVENVSWQDAQAFCEAASRHIGRTVRLLTEAEWEYACRAGTTTEYHFGDEIDSSKMSHRDDDLLFPDRGYGTSVVGRFPANPWGLFDTHGNVFEWCEDWYWSRSYSIHPCTDPLYTNGSITGHRVCRGGSWCCDPRECRAARRFHSVPGTRVYDLGFRVVFTA